MLKTSKIVVQVKFTHKNGIYTAHLKALHSNAHVIAKENFKGKTRLEVFEYSSAFISKHEATGIGLGRGLIEDSFANYLTETHNTKEVVREVEGLLVEHLVEGDKELAFGLRTYKACQEDAIRHEDYEGMLLQGILYNNLRDEIYASSNQLANAFEATVEVPLIQKYKVKSAIISLNESSLQHGLPIFSYKSYNRVMFVESKDYKLTINFI